MENERRTRGGLEGLEQFAARVYDLDEVGKAIIDLNGLPSCIKTGGIEPRHIVKIAKGCVEIGYEWHL